MANNLVTRQNFTLQAWIIPTEISETGEITEGGILYIESDDADEVLWYKTPTGTRIALGGNTEVRADNYLTGATLEGTVLNLHRNNSLPVITVELSSLQGGTGETATLYSISSNGNITVNGGTTTPSAVHTKGVVIGVAPGYQIPTVAQIQLWGNHTASANGNIANSGHLWVGQDLRTDKKVQFRAVQFSDNKPLSGVTYTIRIAASASDFIIPSEKAIRTALDAIVVGGGDNLGNHIATTNLTMSGFDILQAKDISPANVEYGTLSLPDQYWTIPTITKTYRGDTIKLSCPADPSLFFGDIVCFTKNSGGAAQPVLKAKANSTTTMPAIGMVISSDSSSVTILLRGLALNTVSVTWDWEDGKPLFLSETIAGTMTQTLGAKSGNPGTGFIQVLGVSITNQLIYFNPQLMYLDREVTP